VLLQVREYAETFYSLATALPQVWGGACPSIDSYPYSATPQSLLTQSIRE